MVLVDENATRGQVVGRPLHVLVVAERDQEVAHRSLKAAGVPANGIVAEESSVGWLLMGSSSARVPSTRHS